MLLLVALKIQSLMEEEKGKKEKVKCGTVRKAEGNRVG